MAPMTSFPNIIELPVIDPSFGSHKFLILSDDDGFIPIGAHVPCMSPKTCQCSLHLNARNLKQQGYAIAYSCSLNTICLVQINLKVGRDNREDWHRDTERFHEFRKNMWGIFHGTTFQPKESFARHYRDRVIEDFYKQVLSKEALILPKR